MRVARTFLVPFSRPAVLFTELSLVCFLSERIGSLVYYLFPPILDYSSPNLLIAQLYRLLTEALIGNEKESVQLSTGAIYALLYMCFLMLFVRISQRAGTLDRKSNGVNCSLTIFPRSFISD